MSRRFHSLTATSGRRGLSLVELMIAVSIMSMTAVSLGAVVITVQAANQYAVGRGTAVQHGRVAVERIRRACASAYATTDFPGFWVIAAAAGGYEFPDTLVVWTPDGSPTNLLGPPLYRELTYFTPDRSSPNRLLEITIPPTFNPVAPAIDQIADWLATIDNIHSSEIPIKVQLTDLLRVADSETADAPWRGVVRFGVRYAPTIAQRADYQSGGTAWEDLLWPLDVYSPTQGTRQSWCRIELQLVPPGVSPRGGAGRAQAVPVFGSAELNYQLER